MIPMPPEVETAYGRLEGIEQRGTQVFRGIPFALPPCGRLRWCAPSPPEPWAGVRDATRFAPSAPQERTSRLDLSTLGLGFQSEDCLYLNIYTPAVGEAGTRRPVLVWIHGGSFSTGSGSQTLYRGHALCQRGDVVVVTLNYRLGALGFLYLAGLGDPDFETASNCGLRDQIAALEWIQENIAAFGGDPERVTVFGESAGAMSVGTLLGVPKARGLFQQAIAQSGAASQVHTREAAEQITSIFLEEVGLTRNDTPELRKIPLEQIRQAQTRVLQRAESPRVLLPFQPVVDGDLIPVAPIEAVRAGQARDIPLLIGTNRNEWTFWAITSRSLSSLTEERLLHRIQARLPAWIPETGRPAAAQRLLQTFRNASTEQCTPAQLFVEFQGMRIFHLPAIELAQAQSRHQVRTFSYLMAWPSPAAEGRLGACHAIELPFVFGMIGRKGIELLAGEGPAAEQLQDRIMDAWISFARTGHPGHTDLPDWEPFEAERRATLVLSDGCRLEHRLFEAERNAWSALQIAPRVQTPE